MGKINTIKKMKRNVGVSNHNCHSRRSVTDPIHWPSFTDRHSLTPIHWLTKPMNNCIPRQIGDIFYSRKYQTKWNVPKNGTFENPPPPFRGQSPTEPTTKKFSIVDQWSEIKILKIHPWVWDGQVENTCIWERVVQPHRNTREEVCIFRPGHVHVWESGTSVHI